MMNRTAPGLLVAIHGLGNALWSRGMDEFASKASAEGWKASVFEHYEGEAIRAFIRENRTAGVPLVVIGHSMGGDTLDDLADDIPIDLGVFVDSAWPETVPDTVHRVLSVRAARLGRFHVKGGRVNRRMVIPDTTHTTVDDAPALHEAVLAIMRELVSKEPEMNSATKPFYMGIYNPLDDKGIRDIASTHAIPEYLLRAVIEIEAAGKGQHSSGAVVARYEPHIAYRYAEGRQRTALVEAGLAWPNWRRGEPSGSPYHWIDRCAAIAGNEIAALATSWGMGQVMGFNHAALGYDSAVDMVQAFAKGEAIQLEGMLTFIEAAKLQPALLNRDWRTFAAVYNGPAHEAHDYAGRLAAAARKWRKALGEGGTLPVDPQTAPVPKRPDPPINLPIDLHADRRQLAALFPALDAGQIDLVLALGFLLGPPSSQRAPPGVDTFEHQPSQPAPSAGFSLPDAQAPLKGVFPLKNIFRSKTIWGVATMVISQLLPSVLPALGYDFTSADAQALVSAMETLLGAAGTILAIYGRVKADRPLSLLK